MKFDRIIELRDELELTQRVISEKLGCTRSAYSLWELNKNTIPLEYLNKISNELKVNIDYLVYLSDEKYIDFNNVDIDRKIVLTLLILECFIKNTPFIKLGNYPIYIVCLTSFLVLVKRLIFNQDVIFRKQNFFAYLFILSITI